jgi:hypothetical protein
MAYAVGGIDFLHHARRRAAVGARREKGRLLAPLLSIRMLADARRMAGQRLDHLLGGDAADLLAVGVDDADPLMLCE